MSKAVISITAHVIEVNVLAEASNVLLLLFFCVGPEAADSPEAALQRMRKRVYALSSEVAHLTRERDMLRIQSGQQPGPTLPAGR